MDETGQAPTFDETPSFTDHEDPAAAFLQREQEELGDLGEDSLGFTPGSTNVRRFSLNHRRINNLNKIDLQAVSGFTGEVGYKMGGGLPDTGELLGETVITHLIFQWRYMQWYFRLQI